MKDFQQLDFLNLVEYLMRISSETVDNLRLRPHDYDTFTFKEALPEDAQDEGEDLVAITQRIVSRYLHRTEAEQILGLPYDFRRPEDPIERNTSHYPHLVDFWEREYYQRKKEIDQEIRSASERMRLSASSIAEDTSEAIRRSTGIESRLRISSNWTDSWLSNQSKRELYQKAGLFEDPVLLYEFCFSEAVQVKQWDELNEEELLSALNEENVPIGDFERISGRKITIYRGNLMNWYCFSGRSTEELGGFNQAFTAFVEHPEFTTIYNQALTIEKVADRWAFILRRAYELGQEETVNIHLGAIAQENHLLFQKRLEEYGLVFLCTYFRLDKGTTTGELCLIDTKTEKEPISSICGGRYDICQLYSGRINLVPLGKFNLPNWTETLPPRFKVPEIDVSPVDLDDLQDWWQKEGKYE